MPKKADSQEIQATLAKLIRPNMTPEQLLKETKRAHPTASKSEIVRAAFASMIALAGRDPDIALMLQSFALAERRKPEVNE